MLRKTDKHTYLSITISFIEQGCYMLSELFLRKIKSQLCLDAELSSSDLPFKPITDGHCLPELFCPIGDEHGLPEKFQPIIDHQSVPGPFKPIQENFTEKQVA